MRKRREGWAEYEARIRSVANKSGGECVRWVKDVIKCLSPDEWARARYNNPIIFAQSYSEALDCTLRAFYWTHDAEFQQGVQYLARVLKKKSALVESASAGTSCSGLSRLHLLAFNVSAAVGCLLVKDPASSFFANEALRIFDCVLMNDYSSSESLFAPSNAKKQNFVCLTCSGWLPLLLRGDYSRVHEWYDRGFRWSTLDIEKNSARLVAKLCYMLARVGDGSADDGMRYGAAAVLTQVKLDWLDSQIRGDTWFLTFSDLYLMQHLKHQVYGEAAKDPWNTFDELLPETIMAEVKAISPD